MRRYTSEIWFTREDFFVLGLEMILRVIQIYIMIFEHAIQKPEHTFKTMRCACQERKKELREKLLLHTIHPLFMLLNMYKHISIWSG